MLSVAASAWLCGEARVETPPGDHGYEYVRTVFAQALAFLGDRLAKPAGR